MKKKKPTKQQEYIVISEYGYFTGLKYGGEPQWSMDITELTPYIPNTMLNRQLRYSFKM